ncbi:hypothetical protein A7U60_g1254 [Sanghuangporus baumii]|uniref:Uncharacterized protein n=1 Tax=Sanghuangporus baumii TaxID=108892 RepID=A0A9Q5I4F3_SANBA|nr:hypothetical protein A7U60_g1254 [Sanghuangporus baumii]
MDVDVQPSFDGPISAHSPQAGQTTLPAQLPTPAPNAVHVQPTPSYQPTLPQNIVSYNPEILSYQESNRVVDAPINIDPHISAPQDFAPQRPGTKRPFEGSRLSTNLRLKKVFLTSDGILEMIDEPDMEARQQELQNLEERISTHKQMVGEELHTRLTQVNLEMQKLEAQSKALEGWAKQMSTSVTANSNNPYQCSRKQLEDWERQLTRQKLQMAGQSEHDGRIRGQSTLAGRHSVSSATPRKSHRYRNQYIFEEAGYEPDIDKSGKSRVVRKIAKKQPKHKSPDYNLRTKRIRNIFMSFFDKIESERGFGKHVPANKKDVKAYERNEHDGPSASDCRIDVYGHYNSRWNATIAEFVYAKVLKEENLKALPEWMEIQTRALIFRKIRRAATKCRAGMQMTNESEDAEMETEEEYAAVDKSFRHKTRQRTLFKQRLRTCERKLGMAACWDFLGNMISTYGVDGMSSDETGDDETYHIKELLWRKGIEHYLNFINSHRSEVVTGHGSGPRQRVRDGNFTSERDAALKLPRILYDEKWLAIGLYKQDKVLNAISKDEFKWMEIRSSQN